MEIIHPDALHELTANELFEYVDTVKTLFCKEAELGMFSAECTFPYALLIDTWNLDFDTEPRHRPKAQYAHCEDGSA